jgi:hypothetical protein
MAEESSEEAQKQAARGLASFAAALGTPDMPAGEVADLVLLLSHIIFGMDVDDPSINQASANDNRKRLATRAQQGLDHGAHLALRIGNTLAQP